MCMGPQSSILHCICARTSAVRAQVSAIVACETALPPKEDHRSSKLTHSSNAVLGVKGSSSRLSGSSLQLRIRLLY
eukprot:1380447-Amphidinium_carterae.1